MCFIVVRLQVYLGVSYLAPAVELLGQGLRASRAPPLGRCCQSWIEASQVLLLDNSRVLEWVALLVEVSQEAEWLATKSAAE